MGVLAMPFPVFLIKDTEVWVPSEYGHISSMYTQNSETMTFSVRMWLLWFCFNCFFSRRIVSHSRGFCSSGLVTLLQPVRATPEKKKKNVALSSSGKTWSSPEWGIHCSHNHHFILYNLWTSIPFSSGVWFYIPVQSCYTPHHLQRNF